MAEEAIKVEETVKETVEQQEQKQPEQKVETPKEDDGVVKIDLRNLNQETDAVKEQITAEVPVRDESGTSGEVQEQNIEKTDEKPTGESGPNNEETSVIERLPDEEKVEEEKSLVDKIKDIPNKLKEEQEDVNNNQEARELPENIEKLIQFMEETGGNVEDYVNLNKNYDDMEDMQLLREYYRQTKPHLQSDEIDFLIEDNFSYDEEVDEEKDIKRKKLAFKESIAEAKSNLTNLKSKYYDELRLSSRLTPEQKDAVKFYDDYKLSQDSSQKQRNVFEQKTNELFTDDFKGFEYKVGDSRYRYNVKDVNTVKNNQSDINTLVSKFVNDNNEMADARGYHKALFTAMNADAIANHFYEQGKSDAIKEQMKSSKNIDMNPRGSHENVTTTSGMQVKAISGDDMDRLRIKMKQ
tara:strand:+ start:435 stop:1664 length:1230 start_codon:yes stop_codon:yes gene_type:complete